MEIEEFKTPTFRLISIVKNLILRMRGV